MTRSATVRLSLNVAADTAAALKAAADRNGITLTYLVRRMVALWLLVEGEKEEGGKLFVTRDGKLREVVLL